MLWVHITITSLAFHETKNSTDTTNRKYIKKYCSIRLLARSINNNQISTSQNFAHTNHIFVFILVIVNQGKHTGVVFWGLACFSKQNGFQCIFFIVKEQNFILIFYLFLLKVFFFSYFPFYSFSGIELPPFSLPLLSSLLSPVFNNNVVLQL